MNEIAPEVPGLKAMSAAPARYQREGFALYIPGECLKRDSRLWSQQQREQGVWLKGIFLSASEEEDALMEAIRENKGALASVYTIRKTLAAIAESLEAEDPETGDRRPAPGAWKPIPGLELRPYWEEIGSMGRTLYTQAYQHAHTPSEGARALALASFRTVV